MSFATEISETIIFNEINVYPNPVINQYTILIKNASGVSQQGEITLYTTSGVLLSQERIQIVGAEQSIQMSRGTLAGGTYILRVSVGSEVSTIKLLIQ